MGNSVAPKTFAPSTPFGQTPASPIATQTQPLAAATGTATPAMSGYSMAPQTPATPAPAAAPVDPEALINRQQLKASLSNKVMPFYGY